MDDWMHLVKEVGIPATVAIYLLYDKAIGEKRRNEEIQKREARLETRISQLEDFQRDTLTRLVGKATRVMDRVLAKLDIEELEETE